MWLRVMKIVVFMLGVGCIHVVRAEFGWTAVLIMAVYGFLTAVWFGLDHLINEKEG